MGTVLNLKFIDISKRAFIGTVLAIYKYFQNSLFKGTILIY